MLTLIPQRTSIRFLCARLRAFCCSSPHLAARCPAFLLLSPEFDHSTIPIHRRADFVAVVFAPSAIVPPETFCIWSLSLSSCQPCPDLVVRGSSLAYFCQSRHLLFVMTRHITITIPVVPMLLVVGGGVLYYLSSWISSE